MLAKFLFVVVLIAFAACLRIWPLDGLENRLAWLTFYPMVMVSALLGGLIPGIFAVGLTIALTWLWGPTGVPFAASPTYWLGAAVFIFNGVLIASMGEGMQRAQARLAVAKEEAEIANQSKSAFLANMSHELRTPLNAILGFSQLMRGDQKLQKDQRSKLEIINNSGQHLLTMINEVLDYSKIEAGKEVLRITTFNLIDALEETAQIASVRAGEKSISYTVELDDVVDCFVAADRAKLSQIILNILGNAVKFTEKGGVVLRARTEQSTETTLTLYIEIEDTGTGISTDKQENIFKPFYQTESDNVWHRGTGLGLSISKQLTDLLGGTIRLESELGKGSLFILQFPLALSVEAAATEAIDKHPTPRGLAPGQQAWRILITDDDRANRLLLSSQLQKVGFETEVAVDGADAVEKFKSWSPHFIWMDIRMPVMNGYEATEKIRSMRGGEDLPIVAITASVFADQHQKIYDSGCNEIVHKPYNEYEIFETLSKYLNVKYLYDEETKIKPAVLDSEDINAAIKEIPEDIRDKMNAAIESCDDQAMQQLIEKLPADVDSAKRWLQTCLNNYDWDSLENALEKARSLEGAS